MFPLIMTRVHNRSVLPARSSAAHGALSGLIALTGLIALPACSSAPADGGTTTPSQQDGSLQGAAGAVSAPGPSAEGPSVPTPGAPSGDTEDTVIDSDVDLPALPSGGSGTETCGGNVVPTAIRDVVLAFVFDVSASMGVDGDSESRYSRTLKWEPVVAASKAFFADPSSQGMSATLTFFPNEFSPLYPDRGGNGIPDETCDAAEYADADVPLTPLPSADFAAGIDAVTPEDEDHWRSGTPTLPALQGTYQSLLKMKEQNPDASYSVVLVTDGEPQGCPGGIADIAAEVAGVSADIQTYVIGVESPTGRNLSPRGGGGEGPGLGNLAAIAEAGGTDHSVFLIDTNDPDKTSADFAAIIAQIREENFSCEIGIPTADGATPTMVNVSFESADGVKTGYVLDQDCASDSGWRYNDPTAPTAIELCPNVCESLRGHALDGQLSVELGCPPIVYTPQ